jgi:hypothetical protein
MEKILRYPKAHILVLRRIVQAVTAQLQRTVPLGGQSERAYTDELYVAKVDG